MAESASTTSLRLSRYALPGFGLPLNFTPRGESTTEKYSPALDAFVPVPRPVRGDWGSLFPTALDEESCLRLTTLREFTMMRFMNQLTDKPGWEIKVFDETIVAKWKDETVKASDIDMTEAMFQYCIDELRYKSKIFQETGAITVYNGDVVKSDTTIPSSVRDDLRAAVAPLEDVPDVHRDWHPGSNETVLDLVHPSLFPLIYGRTRILKDSVVGLGDCIRRSCEGDVLQVPPESEAQVPDDNDSRFYNWDLMRDPFSRKFQWLPCEVEIESDTPRITSYINNLHPHSHKSLYEVIEKIIGFTIPLWNQTLTPLKQGEAHHLRIIYSECEYDPDPETMPEEAKPQQLPDEEDWIFWERFEQWEMDTRRVIRPEPAPFTAPVDVMGKVDLKHDFGERGLQVIVKLANIHLTPEKPEYAGGTWHVEGQLNEHICATALYYYDTYNITQSLLSFRQLSRTEDGENIDYQQQHHEWLTEVFGCEQDCPALQYIGDIVAEEGRLLTFPNVFQHQVAPFRLIDDTKPGHRKILALFLVDPHIRVISTANVPCQQKDWWSQELLAKGLFRNLPNEMLKEIMDNVDEFPIGMDEAKKLRVELMEERRSFVLRHDQQLKSSVFSLCEH